MESRLVSENFTPTTIKNKEFNHQVWGYSPKEVVEFLDAVAKTWEAIQRQERDWHNQINDLKAEIVRLKNRDSEIEKMREKAHQEAENIKNQARTEASAIFSDMEARATQIREKTEEWLANALSEIEETERRKTNFVSAFRSALDSHYELLKNESEPPEPLGKKLQTFLQSSSLI